MNKSIVKNVLREIRYSLGRYLAIVAIIALGVGFFAGLRVTRPAMLRTLDTYLDEQNMYDFRLLSTLGLTEADAEYLRTVEGVRDACGSVSLEAFTELDGSGDIEGTVITLRSVTKGINLLKLESGRMPERAGECVIDARLFDDDIIGTRVIISDENTDTVKESFTERELVIVGRVWSPYYLNIDRGNTSLGDGTVDTFVFLHPSGFTVDYYTEMFVDIDTDAEPYTEEYAEAVGGMTDRVSEALSHRADVRYEALLDEARAQIADGYAELDAAKAELENQRADVKSQLEKAEKELDSGLAQYESGLALFEQNRPLIDMLEPTVAHFASLVEETWSRLEKTENESERRELERQLEIYETQYGTVKSQLDGIMAMKTQLDEAYAKIESGRAELEEKRLEAEAAFLDAEKKIKDGEDELAKAEKSISDIPRAETYLLTREQNVGYVCFENDSSTVEGIARVFPVLFFLVAILVCMTTMTRMVDDQRTQIGTLKALGYSSTAVVSKYVAYSGSAALVGAVGGFFLGSLIFPPAIWSAFDMLYGFSDVEVLIDPVTALLSVVAALACSVGTTWFCCKNELVRMPASLMRPKSPKAGRRILLERIPFLWNNLGFLFKVSLRNIFRYKKRIVMMLLGVGGCTALVLTGFGLKDSISDIAEYQFDDIMKYDYTVSLGREYSGAEQSSFISQNSDLLESAVFVTQKNASVTTDEGIKNVNVVATDDESLSMLFDMHNGEESIPFPEKGQTVINVKIAELLGVGVGDTITLDFGDTRHAELYVSGVMENYVYNYAIMRADTYAEATKSPTDFNTVYATVKDGTDVHATAAELMRRCSDIINVSVTADIREMVDNMMVSLNAVVWLVIGSAAMLAFVVLINLSNINITERVREIATIKVLGFHARETASYVFRENMILTVIGALAGLGLGVLMHSYVMSQIVIDMVTFKITLLPESYVLAVVLTILFAILTNQVMRVKLARINMAESLKSVE